jgi:tRNA threonylcarbamoyladenosine biosynthesis protein TsaE
VPGEGNEREARGTLGVRTVRSELGALVELRVATPGEMRALGRRLASLLQAGDLVVLAGPLGAGKTTLVQGIGAGLNVRGPITSPTFVIARVYPSLSGGPALLHADAYRLGGRAEVDDLDLDTDTATSVTVVEWGEGLVEDLAESHLLVTIEMDEPSGDRLRGPAAAEEPDEPRTVRLTGAGERWQVAAESARLVLTSAPEAL